MKRATEKLHSRRGASVILALLLMLAAVMISSVIISAALTASHRVKDDIVLQEDALAISSAGKVIVDYLKHEPEFAYKWVDWEDGTGTEPTPGSATTLVSGKTSEAVRYLADLAYPMTTADKISNQKLTVYFTSADAEIENATMVFSMERSGSFYLIDGTIFLGSDPAKSSQKLFLSAQLIKDSTVTGYPQKEGKKIKDATDTEPAQYEMIDGDEYTVSWKLDDEIHLVSRKELIVR